MSVHLKRKSIATRAWRWQQVLECGKYGTLAELAAAERIGCSYVCRVLWLTLLPPTSSSGSLTGRRRQGRSS
jgi:hypothetical protein